jgi:hypothetical protein
MRKPQPDWPAFWETAYQFDLLEFFGEDRRAPGYVCAYQNRFQKLMDMVETHFSIESPISRGPAAIFS